MSRATSHPLPCRAGAERARRPSVAAGAVGRGAGQARAIAPRRAQLLDAADRAQSRISPPSFSSRCPGTTSCGCRYKGTGPGLLAVVAGEVQMMFPAAGSVATYLKSGKLRALAVTSASRSALVPELPTLVESGLPDYEAVSVYALFAPAKTPASVVNRMSEATIRAMHNPEVKQRFLNAGVETIGAPADRLEATIRTDIVRWGKLIRAAGIREE